MITVDVSRCTGCRRCETACAFYHTGKTNRNLARIKVVNIYELGIDGPVVCSQCEERYCTDCPEDAITIGEDGQIMVTPALCVQCGICEEKCPMGAIQVFEGIPFVCDLCGGDPRCVEACTEGAISFEPEKTETISLSAVEERTEKMNPSEKRELFIRGKGKELREHWRDEDA